MRLCWFCRKEIPRTTKHGWRKFCAMKCYHAMIRATCIEDAEPEYNKVEIARLIEQLRKEKEAQGQL